jgi:hypothetical protein
MRFRPEPPMLEIMAHLPVPPGYHLFFCQEFKQFQILAPDLFSSRARRSAKKAASALRANRISATLRPGIGDGLQPRASASESGSQGVPDEATRAM